MYDGIAEVNRELLAMDKEQISIWKCLELYEEKGVTIVIRAGEIIGFETRVY